MKLLIILSVITWCHAAKLDNTYLPPNRAQTSGGSGSFLQAPLTETAQPNTFSQTDASYNQNGNGFAQNGNAFPQNGNGFGQNGNGFGQNGNGFGQNGNGFAQNGNGLAQIGYNANYNGFSNFEAKPERPQAAYERNAAILRENNENNGEAYSYAYETENGIYAEENGVATNGVEAQGGYSYTGDDGQVYSVRYTADQNGFVPQGDHLPTPPPVPEEILKALEQNARDEAAGIYDDGSYNEGKYSNDGNQYANNGYGNINGNAYPTDSDDTVVTNNALFRNQPEANQGTGSAINQGRNVSGFGNQANKAYLPPFANQRAPTQNGNGNGFARRPSFNDRDGYRY